MKKIIKATSGFTLVELIVVIAILGILAGAGTVAYSGYVTRANKSVDQQTVSNLIYAVKLADYANPELIPENSSVFVAVTETGTQAAGGSDSDALEAALEDSVGSLTNIKLNYTNWSGASDGTVLNDMIAYLKNIGYLDEDGNIQITDSDGNTLTASYVTEANELWYTLVGLARAAYPDDTNAYVAKLANYTVTELKATRAADMGSIWASTTSTGRALYTIGAASTTVMTTAFTVWQAQNYAFASYLSATGTTLEDESTVLEEIQNARTDHVWTIYSSETAPTGTSDAQSSNWTTLHEAAKSYLNGGTSSQAYVDGMIYFALMDTVNTLTTEGTYSTDDDDYLDSIGAYISLAATAMSGTIDFAGMYALATSLSGAGTICAITMTKSSDGQWTTTVVPEEAYVTNSTNSSDEDGDGTSYDTSLTLVYDSSKWYHSNKSTLVSESPITLTLSNSNSTYSSCVVTLSSTTVDLTTSTSLSVTSGDGSVVSVSGAGTSWNISAVGTGETTVTFKYGRSASCDVTVTVK